MPSTSLSDSEVIEEAIKLVEEANKRGVVLRILGALAVRIHSDEYMDLHMRLKRLGEAEASFTDIDLIGYSSQRGSIRKFFEQDLGFLVNRQFLMMFGKERLIYRHSDGLYYVDIFLDRLRFSHDVLFGSKPGKGRLELDYPTISLTDLVLEKLQIHEINEKDIKDLIVLFRGHDFAYNDERESINIVYISKILCDDWGFWYDATNNLRKVLSFAEKYFSQNLISQSDLVDVRKKVKELLEYIDKSPKSKKWLKRAKIGVNKKWWRDVEELWR